MVRGREVQQLSKLACASEFSKPGLKKCRLQGPRPPEARGQVRGLLV